MLGQTGKGLTLKNATSEEKAFRSASSKSQYLLLQLAAGFGETYQLDFLRLQSTESSQIGLKK